MKNESWQRFKLEEIIEKIPKQQQIKKSDYAESGEIPIIDQGSEFIGGYTDRTDLQYNYELPVVIFGDHTRNIKYIDFPFVVGADGTKLLRPISDDFDLKYFYYALKNIKVRNYGYQRHFKYLKDKEIAKPPLDIQKRIVNFLFRFDNLLNINYRRIQILELISKRLYEKWFVLFDLPFNEKLMIINIESKNVPEGWKVMRLGDLCNIVMGQSPKSEYYNEDRIGLPFHQGVRHFGDVVPKDLIYCTVEKRIANPGDILFSVRAPVGRMNLTKKKIIIGRGLSAIRSKNNFQNFIYYQLKYIFHKEDIMGGGTIFNAITKDALNDIKVLKPPDDLILKYETLVKPLIKEILLLDSKNDILKNLLNIFLKKVFSQEIHFNLIN